jgi:hypothetical protein
MTVFLIAIVLLMVGLAMLGTLQNRATIILAIRVWFGLSMWTKI